MYKVIAAIYFHIIIFFYFSDPGQTRQACKSLFAWNFKCYQEDKCGAIACDSGEDQEAQALTEPPIYACKFGEGPDYGHILVIANEDGHIGLRDTRKTGDVAPVAGKHLLYLNVYYIIFKCLYCFIF